MAKAPDRKPSLSFQESSQWGRPKWMRGLKPMRIAFSLKAALFGLMLITGQTGVVWAAAGHLDLSFGTEGKVTTNFGFDSIGFGSFDQISHLALQADGKILALGISSAFPRSTLIRYNPEGSIDTSFGLGGKVTNLPGAGVVVRPNGKILIAGVTGFGVTQLNSDGSLDTGFGFNGTATTTIIQEQQVNDLILQPDGKVIVAGTIFVVSGRSSDFILVRYNPDGSIDTGFGGSGIVQTNFFDSFSLADSVILQADGKIIEVGSADIPIVGPRELALVRFNSNGSLDPTYGSAGKVVIDPPVNIAFGDFFRVSDAALQIDGKIVVVGNISSLLGTRFVVARLKVDGSLDNAFGTNGLVVDSFAVSGFLSAIAIQPDNKILLAGSAFNVNNASSDFALLRYKPNGSLDTSFAPGGKVTTDFFGFNDNAQDLVLQPDGKIVVAGDALNISASSQSTASTDFALVRYKGDPIIGRDFDLCLQSDSNGDILYVNTANGEYEYLNCVRGISLEGRGTLLTKGCTITLQDLSGGHKVSVLIDNCRKTGTASIQIQSLNTTITILDRNITNNSCVCR